MNRAQFKCPKLLLLGLSEAATCACCGKSKFRDSNSNPQACRREACRNGWTSERERERARERVRETSFATGRRYVYIYIYIYTYFHTYLYTKLRVCMCIEIHTDMPICTYAYTHVHISICMFMYTYIRTQKCIYIFLGQTASGILPPAVDKPEADAFRCHRAESGALGVRHVLTLPCIIF